MEVYEITIKEGWYDRTSALFSIDDKSESRMTQWAVGFLSKSRSDLPEREQDLESITKNISKFKLTSLEVLEVDSNTMVFVRIKPVL